MYQVLIKKERILTLKNHKFYTTMKYISALLLIVLIAGISVSAQSTKERKEKPDEELTWKQKMDKADELMLSGSYYNAIELYKDVIEEKPDRIDVAYNLANALYLGRNYKDALTYYKMAYDADPKKYAEAQFYYGLMLKMTGQYQQAYDELQSFYKGYRGSGKEGQELKRRAKDEYEGAQLGMALTKDSLEVEIDHLNTNVNALYTEFAPRWVDDKTLLFSSLRLEEEDSVITLDKDNKKMPKARLYETSLTGKGWGESAEMDGPFNDTKDHTGNGAYSSDGKRFYFTRCTTDKGVDVSCDIYMSVYEDGKWSDPKSLEINDKKANDTHPFIAKNKNNEILFFASNREGGEGGMDIYASYIYRDGKDHREPQNIGRRINTPGNEITPFYDDIEEILYYSSDREINIGGFDIFKSKGSGRRWAKPINAGYPLNSPADDMYYAQNADGKMGYLVSNRTGSISPKWENCCDDIYAFKFVYPPKFTIMGKVYAQGDTTKTPIDSAAVQLFLAEKRALIDSATSDPKKPYEFYLGTQYSTYRLEARKEGYLSGTNTTSTVGLTESDTLWVDLFLTPISKTKPVVLRNVYFDLDRAEIREDAKPSLDTIYNLLAENPNIKIELSSHTDSRASKAHNIDLSQRRADSSKAYLVALGIDPERIVAKGYGEERLLNNCSDGVQCSDIEHQINRRTEFQIIGEIPGTIITYDKSEIEKVKKKKREGTLKGNEEIWEFEEEPNPESP